MAELKAFRINDCDTYAGYDLESAIAKAMSDSGLPRDEVFDAGELCEASLDEPVTLDEPGDPKTTIGAILAEMDGPGIVCSTEW